MLKVYRVMQLDRKSAITDRSILRSDLRAILDGSITSKRINKLVPTWGVQLYMMLRH